jgi:hypothetical protein
MLLENNAESSAVKWLYEMTIAHVNGLVIGIDGKTAATVIGTKLVIHSRGDAGVATTVVWIRYSVGTTSSWKKLWEFLLLCWVMLSWTISRRVEEDRNGMDSCVGTIGLGEIVGEC